MSNQERQANMHPKEVIGVTQRQFNTEFARYQKVASQFFPAGISAPIDLTFQSGKWVAQIRLASEVLSHSEPHLPDAIFGLTMRVKGILVVEALAEGRRYAEAKSKADLAERVVNE